MVGIYWNNHHHLLRASERISGSAMWSNLLLLFWLSLMPSATAWVGKYPNHALPAALYGVVALGAGIAYNVLTVALIRASGEQSLINRGVGRNVKGIGSQFLYAAGVGLAFVNPVISYVLYSTVAVMWFIPEGRFVRASSSGMPTGISEST
jgi:uncharacterized membrane protein